MDDTFPGQQATAAVDEVASESSGVEATGDVVGEGDEEAASEVRFVELAWLHVEVLAFGKAEEGLEQGGDLAGGGGVDTDTLAGVEAELVVGGVLPGLHEVEEIGGGPIAEAVLPQTCGVGVDASEE